MNCKLWIANLCEKSDINGLIGRIELQEYYNAPEVFERRSLHAVKVCTAHRMKKSMFFTY